MVGVPVLERMDSTVKSEEGGSYTKLTDLLEVDLLSFLISGKFDFGTTDCLVAREIHSRICKQSARDLASVQMVCKSFSEAPPDLGCLGYTELVAKSGQHAYSTHMDYG